MKAMLKNLPVAILSAVCVASYSTTSRSVLYQ